jgi:mono/diheme cytochrome c family protein
MAWRSLVSGVVAAGLVAGVTFAQRNPPLVIGSMAGRDLFGFYCATCHGRDGKGTGPVAAALKTPPADLTIIARRNGGRFPRSDVIAFVADEKTPIAAHGPREMPVWGPIFRALDPSDTRTKVRIDNLVTYIESIQAK